MSPALLCRRLGQAHFTAYNGSVARPAALVSDDSRHPLHRGHEIGSRYLDDEYVAIQHLADLRSVIDYTNCSGPMPGLAEAPETKAFSVSNPSLGEASGAWVVVMGRD